MEFRTEYKAEVAPSGYVSHSSKIMLIGSCFSENIGEKLERNGFHAFLNPYGILFNPDSIRDCLKDIITGKKFQREDFFEHEGVWHNYHLHGSFSSANIDDAVNFINARSEKAAKFIKETNVLILTFGTAWIYELRESGKTVANCHKMPQQLFTKRKLTVGEIVNHYSWILDHLKNMNPDTRIIFTISPVLHLRDGMIENNQSKSILNVAIQELLKKFDCAEYFPSYEIMLNDLRDYRFYASDLSHPSQLAIDYIWDKFRQTYFNASTLKAMSEVEQWFQKKEHRAIHPETEAHKKFIAALEKETEAMFQKYPHLKEI
jgi:hypothetical protein